MSEQIIAVAGIQATVTRKKVKNLRVTIVPPDGAVRVSAPKRMPEAIIRAFLLEKADWIRTHAEKVRRSHANEPRDYESGETVRLFGQVYPLVVRDSQKKNGAALDGDRIVLSLRGDVPKEKREAILNEWLRERLKAEIEHYLPLWSEKTGLMPNEWRIRDMTSRWGSCNTRTKKITLNLQLAHYPIPCLEYVILHELAHIRVHGHGPEFKAILDRYMPDWRDRKKLLNP
jgi:predicted metal-dependent hydrolase